MKYILSFLFVVVFATACLGSYTAKCGVPSCKKCASATYETTYNNHYVEEEVHHEYCGVPSCKKCVTTTTTCKPSCPVHYVEEEVHHEYCGVPSCKKCVTPTTTCKPSCPVHYVEEEVYHDDCDVTTTTEPNCEHTFEEEHCPHGYFWNGYFCAPECKCTTHKQPYY